MTNTNEIKATAITMAIEFCKKMNFNNDTTTKMIECVVKSDNPQSWIDTFEKANSK